MRSLGQDIRFALRIFARSPGFALVSVTILALGIGANTAIFSILNALVLRDLPVRHPERLVQVAGIYRNGSKVPFSFSMFEEIKRGQRVFSDLFGWSGGEEHNVQVDGRLFLASVRAVTGNYYSGLRATALLGRLIAPQDARGSAISQVAVISYDFWQNHFGRDRNAIGKTLRIEGAPFTIVGITKKWFAGMTPGEPVDVTIPMKSSNNRALLWVVVTGRLKHSVTMEQARAQLQSFWPEALRATVPTEIPGRRRESFLAMRLDVESAAAGANADLRARIERPFGLLMAIVAFVLLIACVNLANLTLARAATRGREMSVRVALGARRAQIVRQLLTESALLSVVGGSLALAFAYWLSQGLVRLMMTDSLFSVALDLRPDWRVFSFTAAVAILTGLLIGLAPAWQLSGHEPAAVLRSSERSLGSGTGRWGKVLIVVQIALSLILLQGAGLLQRTFRNLRASDPGFRKTGVLEVSVYPRPGSSSKLDILNAHRKELMGRLAAVPGVVSVAFSNQSVPAGAGGYTGWRDTVALTVAGPNSSRKVLSTLVAVSPGFFETLRISMLSGRDFAWTDDNRHPRVAIVDGNLARRLHASGDVTGELVRFGVQAAFQNLEVIGMVGAARVIDLRHAEMPVLYIPCLQYGYCQYGNLFVRTDHPGALARTVESEIESAGHEYSTGAKTLEQTSLQALHQERATATLSTLFGAVALLLAGTGLLSLMSYTVTRRTHEIGIRMALGAQQGSVLGMILRETLLLTLVGIALGAPGALAATHLIAHLLFGVSADDPLTLATVSITLLAVGIVAGLWPARRAMNVDPIVALRYE